jgi:hypothetical protein
MGTGDMDALSAHVSQTSGAVNPVWAEIPAQCVVGAGAGA